MKRLVTFCVVLLLASFASAQSGFSAAEITELKELRSSFDSALKVVALCGAASTAADCQKLMQGNFYVGQGTGWVFGVNVHANDTTGAALLAGPREDVLDESYAMLDLALAQWCGSTDLVAPCTGGAAVTWGTNANFNLAVSKLNGFDRTLAYATPYPANFPNQFGPHGDYARAQHKLWRGFRYLHVAMKDGWLAGALAGSLAECTTIFSSASYAMRRLWIDTAFMSAHIIDANTGYTVFQNSFVEGLPPEDPMNVKTALTEYAIINGPADTAGATTAAQSLFLVLNSACMPTGPLKTFISNVGDSWRNTDAWTGEFSKIEQ